MNESLSARLLLIKWLFLRLDEGLGPNSGEDRRSYRRGGQHGKVKGGGGGGEGG